MPIDPLKYRLLADERLQPLIAAMNEADGNFQDALDALEPSRSPGILRDAYTRKLNAATTPQEIAELTARIASASGDAAEKGRIRSEVLAQNELSKFKSVFPPLISAAENVCKEMLDDALLSERIFFEEHGLEREETGLSRRVKRLLSELAELQRGLAVEPNQPAPKAMPSSFAAHCRWFRGQEETVVIVNTDPNEITYR